MSSQNRRLALISAPFVALATASIALVGCGEGTSRPLAEPVPGQTIFESDDPSWSGGGDKGAAAPNGSYDDAGMSSGADAGASSDTGAATDAAAEDGGSTDPARAIEEADIVKVDGSRLYALSRTGGLSIIDVGTRDQLKFLGRYRTSGDAFEMYVRGGVVLAMVNGFQDWSYDDKGNYSSNQTSRVLALDVKDPAHIAKLGDFEVAGEVSDSRVVGDVMYVVSQENGYCWHCSPLPGTHVLSLAIKDPLAIHKVDEVEFSSPNQGYSWWKRSVTATTSRFYIAGPEWSWTGSTPPRSTIQVLDVSDPNGKLTVGAQVGLEGMIQSRWQMDEAGGVLRVITQPGGWAGLAPTVQTFTVASSSDVRPLGQTSLVLPMPETLMSVRFDGARAYAITTERKDPLFTIDLSDPAKPKQVGELQMPGWIYYMEPRGDRLLGLGFDNGNPDGAMTVSLFDVSDLKTPTMLKRVNFGGSWASAVEDQDRIHKAFAVLDAEHLIMVPFASNDWWSSDGKCHGSTSGVQLIDWQSDTLKLRGVADVWGTPRRAFLHDQRLFAVSDAKVATFDVADRDAPAKKASLDLSFTAHKSVVVGDSVVVLANDGWTGRAQLSVVPRADVTQATPTTIDLSPMLDQSCGYYGWSSWWSAGLYANGGYVYVVVPSAYAYDKSGAYTSSTLVGVIDARNPKAPRLVGKAKLSGLDGLFGSYGNYGYYGGYGYYGYGSSNLDPGQATVQRGDVLVSMTTEWASTDGAEPSATTRFATLDLRDPANPRAGKPLALPSRRPYTGLQVSGGHVMTSHAEPTDSGRVRYYVDELDLSDPLAPKLARSVNVPGSLVSFDAAASRAVTVDYRRTVTPAVDFDSCTKPADGRDSSWFDYGSKSCVAVHRTFRLSTLTGSTAFFLGSLDVPSPAIDEVVVADGRVLLRSRYDYQNGYQLSDRAWVLDGVRAGGLTLSEPVLLGGNSYYGYGGPTRALGDRALVLDGSGWAKVLDLASPRVVRSGRIDYYWAYDVTMTADTAYASLGDYGLVSYPLR